MMNKIIKASNNLVKLMLLSVLSTLSFSSISQAVVVYQDNFDLAVPYVLDRRPDPTGAVDWTRSRPVFTGVNATIGNGVLTVATTATPYGGAVTLPKTEFDFFAQELSFTFTGITLAPLNVGGLVEPQGVTFGLGSYVSSMNRDNLWSDYSYFGITFLGSGRFEAFGANKIQPGYSLPITLQQIPSPYLNFSLSSLTSVTITLDSTHYAVSYQFGNALNKLTLAGLHGLKPGFWHVSAALQNAARDKMDGETALAAAQASGDAAAIASAQAALNAFLVTYDALILAEQSTLGMSALFIGGVSANNKGSLVTVDAIVVETSNILSVLK